MTKRERSRIEKRIQKIKSCTEGGTTFTVGEQFALAYFFCTPSTFRTTVDGAKLKKVDDFLAAMYAAIEDVTGKPAQASDFPGLFNLWNDSTKKADTSDPESVSYGFIYTYSTPPCPRKEDQQAMILKALRNAKIPD